MKFYDSSNALETKRIESNFARPSLTNTTSYELYGKLVEHNSEFLYSTAKYYNALDDYDKANEEIKEKFGVDLPNPLIDQIPQIADGNDYLYNFVRTKQQRGFGRVFISNYKDHIDYWNNEVSKLQKANPDIEFKTFNQYEEDRAKRAQTNEFLIGEMQKSSRGFMQKYGPTFGAGFRQYMTDPITAVSMPLSFAYSMPRGIAAATLKTGLFEGMLEFGRSSLIETGIQSQRKKLGLSYGTKQALTNIFAATVGGAVLGPAAYLGVRGIGAGAKPIVKSTAQGFMSANDLINQKLFPQRFIGKKLSKLINEKNFNLPVDQIINELRIKDLSEIIEELPNSVRTNPKIKNAQYEINQSIIEQEQNPYTNTVEGQRQYDANVKTAMDQAATDKPIDIIDDPKVELKQPDLENKIAVAESKLAFFEEMLDDLPDTPQYKPQKTKIKKNLAKARKDIKFLKNELKEKFPDPELPPSLQPPKEPKFQTFRQWLLQNKIRPDDANIGDVKAILDKGYFRYTKKDGFSLDELLTRAREDGWLPPARSNEVDDLDINSVLELIEENSIRSDDAAKLQEYNDNITAIEQTIRELEDADIDPMGMSDSQVDEALLKLNSSVDESDLVKFKDEDYIDEFSDDAFNDYVDFVEENKIPENTKLVSQIDEAGKITESKTINEIRKELEQEKRMLDELTKCEGLDL